LLVRRLRGSGRNKRGEDSSDESEEDHSESDNSEADNGDDASDSVGERRSLNSEDPSETRRPGRDARTRAKVTLNVSILWFRLTGEPGKDKTTRTKEDWEKGVRNNGAYFCTLKILLSYLMLAPGCFSPNDIPCILRVSVLYKYVLSLCSAVRAIVIFQTSKRTQWGLIYCRLDHLTESPLSRLIVEYDLPAPLIEKSCLANPSGIILASDCWPASAVQASIRISLRPLERRHTYN
jgi:hypothetical protein